MTKNILEKWYEPFKESKQLSLLEAKELYLKMIQCENEEEKNDLKNTLIFGTMYVLYEQLQSSLVIYCSSSINDLEDIISTSCEIWIRFLLDGSLTEIKYYSDFFKIFFFEWLAKAMHPSDFSFGNYFKCEENKMLNSITKYILYRKNGFSISVRKFEILFSEVPVSFYSMFEGIYHYFKELGILDDENLSQRRLSYCILFLVPSYLEIPFNPKDRESFVSKIKTEEELASVEKDMLRRQVNEIYKNIDIPSKRNQEIFETLCEYYHDKKTLEEIVYSKMYPSLTSVEGVRKASKNTRRRLLKQNRYVKDLREIHEEFMRE